jgi:hypothetical protein
LLTATLLTALVLILRHVFLRWFLSLLQRQEVAKVPEVASVRVASARCKKEHSRGRKAFRASNDVSTASISAAAYFGLKMSNSSARNVASGRWGTSVPDRQGGHRGDGLAIGAVPLWGKGTSNIHATIGAAIAGCINGEGGWLSCHIS